MEFNSCEECIEINIGRTIECFHLVLALECLKNGPNPLPLSLSMPTAMWLYCTSHHKVESVPLCFWVGLVICVNQKNVAKMTLCQF